MSEPFVGQIAIFAFAFAPRDWATCDGQLMSIAQNTALFSLLGTDYGGDGVTTYALPNLKGRVPVGFGQGPGLPLVTRGEVGGQAAVTLLPQNIPAHNHAAHFASDTTALSPAGKYWAADVVGNVTFATTGGIPLAPDAVGIAGTNQPHPNESPYLVLNFCICLFGVYPSRN